MILEDAHGNYIDRDAYNAAYDALTPFLQHAQLRDTVSKDVAVAVIVQRTEHGLERLAELAATKLTLARATLARDVHGGLPNITVDRAAVEAAVKAAAQAVTG